MRGALQYLGDKLTEGGVRSVLDIGASEGALAGYLAPGTAYLGVDLGAHNVEAMREKGLHAARGDANRLGAPDRSVDAVVLAHVLHHLTEPLVAVREAWRVADRVVAVAEPWFDPAHELYAVSAALDEWSKRVHRAVGAVHFPGLPADCVLALLEQQPPAEIVTVHLPTLEVFPVAELVARHDQYVDQLPDHHALRQERLALLEAGGKATRSGSFVAVATR